MNQNGSPREQIVEKLNDIKDEPVFYLDEQEIKWIVRDWIETQSKQKIRYSELHVGNLPGGGPVYVEVEMSEQLVTQAT